MLSLEGLCKSYVASEYAVTGLDLCVQDGAIVALLGHNGAGKSTTLRMAAGILAPSSGRVCVDGIDLVQAGDRNGQTFRRSIGYLSEETHLLDYLTVEEHLWFVGQMLGIGDESELVRRVDSLTKVFGLGEAHKKLLRELSAGQRRRVAIAAVMLNRPRVLLLDEPTNFLDPIGLKILKEYLRDLRREGVACLLATHRLDVAEQLADQIVVIDHGSALFHGSIVEFRELVPAVGDHGSLEELYASFLGN